MKVRTFTGSETAKVDKRVNDWLAKFGIKPHHTNACQFFYNCKGCGERLKPKPGDCCVFCSYGTVPCPPMQAGNSCR